MAEPAPSRPAAGSARRAFEPVVRAAKAVADPLRAGVLRVLGDGSYGVLELCQILDIAQPALSHHLKLLHQAGLVVRRREGNSLFYRRAPAPTALERALLAAIDEAALAADHAHRIEAVHDARRRRSEAFFAQHANDFARHQAQVCEPSVYLPSVLELTDRYALGSGTALEIGPGEGDLLAALAGRFRQVVGIDSAAAMLARCERRVAPLGNVRLLLKDVAAMPTRPRYQLVVAAMVLHHMGSPPDLFRHARRLVGRGGLLVVVELCRHDHEWTRDACGDVWLGFEPQELADWARAAGFPTGEIQLLAQKNGFQIQIHSFRNNQR